MDRQVNMEIEISRDSLSDYLKKRYPTRQDTFNMCPQMLLLLDELTSELRMKFGTIGELDKALARTERAVELFERDNPQSKLLGRRYLPIAIVTISMQLLYDDFPILRKTVVDVVDPDKVAEYKKYILPEGNEGARYIFR